MFERYTGQARRALFFARYESSQLGSMSIEPEHLLLGLLRERVDLSDLVPTAIADAVRQQLLEEADSRPRTSTSVEIPFGKHSRLALETAAREADGLLHGHIGTEHLLLALALTAGTDGVLAAHGVNVETLRTEITNRPVPIGSPPPEITPANPAAHLRDARRHATLRQLDAAVTLVRSIGTEHPETTDVGRLVVQLGRDLESLKAALAEA